MTQDEQDEANLAGTDAAMVQAKTRWPLDGAAMFFPVAAKGYECEVWGTTPDGIGEYGHGSTWAEAFANAKRAE